VKAWRETLLEGVESARTDEAVLRPHKLVITIYI
jgi:hypothetical protein